MPLRRHPILLCRRKKRAKTQTWPSQQRTEVDHVYGRRILVDAARTKTAKLNKRVARGDVEFQGIKKKVLGPKERNPTTEDRAFDGGTAKTSGKDTREPRPECERDGTHRATNRTFTAIRKPRSCETLSRPESDLFSSYKKRYDEDDDFKQTVREYPRVVRKPKYGKYAIAIQGVKSSQSAKN